MRMLLVVLLALPLAAQEIDPRIAEGIKLHDAGRYDEAIAKYREVLADEPDDIMAAYEIGFSLTAKGEYQQCIAVLEPISKKPSPWQAAIITGLGNCLDHAGNSKEAVKTYRRGLKLAPNDAGLMYNLAVTFYGQKKYGDARELLKKELGIRPDHASGRHLLAVIFDGEGFRVPAVVEYLRFLGLEPSGDRAKEAARRLVTLLNLGVEQKDEKNTLITIDPKPRTEEGDFKTAEMMLAIASAARTLKPEGAPEVELTEFEQTARQIASSLRMLTEVREKRGRSYTETHNLPFFDALEDAKLLDVYAGVTILSLNLPGRAEWQTKHENELQQLAQYVRRR
jgi:tetratricopeptide (TPR) repeat protein